MVLQGDSPIRINWLFRGKDLVQTENVKIEHTRRSSTLTFESVNAQNVGEYICVASNKASMATSSFELIVKGDFQINIFWQFFFI